MSIWMKKQITSENLRTLKNKDLKKSLFSMNDYCDQNIHRHERKQIMEDGSA